MIQSSNITNSRLCKYCNQVQIYWNNSKGTFVEAETGNKHFCKSARTKPSNTSENFTGVSKNNRPTFTTGTGKPYTTQQKHSSNSIQVLKGSTELEVQKQYEKLSDIVVGELGGKIHGSQSHYLNNSELRIIVYYEVPAIGAERENRELVKQKLINSKENQ